MLTRINLDFLLLIMELTSTDNADTFQILSFSTFSRDLTLILLKIAFQLTVEVGYDIIPKDD